MRVHVYVHVCAHVYTYVYTYMYRVQAYSNAAPVSNAGNSIKRHPGRNGCQRISPFCIIPFDSVGLHSGHGWLVRLLLLAAAAAAGGPPHPSPLPCRALQGGVTLAAGRLPPARRVSPFTLQFSAPPRRHPRTWHHARRRVAPRRPSPPPHHHHARRAFTPAAC